MARISGFSPLMAVQDCLSCSFLLQHQLSANLTFIYSSGDVVVLFDRLAASQVSMAYISHPVYRAALSQQYTIVQKPILSSHWTAAPGELGLSLASY